MHRFRFLLLLAAVLAALTLAACGDDDDTDAGGQPSTGGPSSTDGGAGGQTLTVEEYQSRSADTPVAVTGLLITDGTTVRLCGTAMESFPPQCGEPSITVTGIDVGAVAGAQTEGSTTWVESAVVTVTRNADGSFTARA